MEGSRILEVHVKDLTKEKALLADRLGECSKTNGRFRENIISYADKIEKYNGKTRRGN